MAAQTASLDALERALNSVLLNIGSVFSEPANLSSEKFSQSTSRLRSTIPIALDDFHGALDALEDDLIRATAVITRDLAVLKAANERPVNHLSESPELIPSVLGHNGAASSTSEPQISAGIDGSTTGSDAIMIDDDTPEVEKGHQENGSPTLNKTVKEPMPDSHHSTTTGTNAGAVMVKAEGEGSAATAKEESTVDLSQEVVTTAEQHTSGAVTTEKTSGVEPTTTDGQPSETNQGLLATSGNTLEPQSVKIEPEKAQSQSTPSIPLDSLDSKEAEASPGNDFSSLLPGLDMYANDPNGDPLSGMEAFNDMSASNAFDTNAETSLNEFPDDIFGYNVTDNGFSQGSGGIDDLIAFDAGDDGNANSGQGGLDAFDESFFNLSGN